MKYKKYSILLLAIAAFSCAGDIVQPDRDPNQYSYNLSTGKCVNYLGQEGYNKLVLEQVYITRNCECTDLSDRELVYLLDTTRIDNWTPLGYNVLDSFNFRGAKLDSSRLFFNYISHADLR